MAGDRLRAKASELKSGLRALADRLRHGDNSELVVWVIPNALAVAHRPLRWHLRFGASRSDLPVEATPEVVAWVSQVRNQGFRSIICLMHSKEIAHYANLELGGGNILDFYRASGLEVCHLPWDDPAHRAADQPNTFKEELATIQAKALECFDHLPKPILLHCSAGIDRSSPVCSYIFDERVGLVPQ